MKLVFLIVCVIAFNAVDCSAQATTLEPPAPPLTYSPWTPDTKRMENGDSEDDDAFERATCGINHQTRDCGMSDGYCTSNATNCNNAGGRMVSKGCKGGSACQCCVPGCNKEYGFFSVGDQCFKLDFRREVSYSSAIQKCQELGLKLAHPQESVGLRSAIMELYGLNDEVWLYARGTGSLFVWSDGYPLRNTSAMWGPGEPDSTATTSCLALGTYDSMWKNYPNQPFYDQSCTIPEYPVCETVN